jgi:probable rRNA maturation factor
MKLFTNKMMRDPRVLKEMETMMSPHEIHVQTKLKSCPLSLLKVKFMIQNLMKHSPVPNYGLFCLLVGDEFMKKRNLKDRKMNESTDILSYRIFPFHKPGEIPSDMHKLRKIGNVIISVPYVEKECQENSVEMGYQMARVLAHGIYHLLGYDHQTDADDAEMERLENIMLTKYFEGIGLHFDPYKSTSTFTRKNFAKFDVIKHIGV